MFDNKTDKNTKTNNKENFFMVIGFLLFSFGLGILFSSNDTDIHGVALTSDGLTTIDNSKFEIIESSSSVSEEGTYTITGKAQQTEEKNFEGLFVTFTMYDKNNIKVRSTTVNTSNYLGNGLWEFSATGNDADKIVTSYKLETIYGY